MANLISKIFGESRPRHAYGLSIADSSLELVSIVEEGQELAINHFSRVLLEPEVIVRGYIRKGEKFLQSMTDLTKDLHDKEKDIVIVAAVPDYQVFTRCIEMSKGTFDKNTYKDDIKVEMSKSLPLEFSEVVLRNTIHTVKDGAKEIMVYATHRSLIDNWVENFAKAKMTLAVVEMSAHGLIRSLIKECPQDTSYCIIDLGGSSTDICISDYHGLRLSASIASGGKQLTQIIAREMKLSTDEAEKQKCTVGLKGKADSLITPIIQRELKPVVDKINQEISYYEKNNPQVKKILLVGGTSAMPGLAMHVSQYCKKEAEIGHPWINVKSEIVSSFALTAKKLPVDDEHHYAGATGTALRGLDKENIKKGIDFLSH
jgi:type IV pilus assembly protein PilM